MTDHRDAFSLLGLNPGDQLTDDEVRAAWRRIAEATHPDRADGGDPERFASAAAAYTELRTQYGRNEARAALRELERRSRPGWSKAGWSKAGWSRAGRSRPGWSLAGRSREGRSLAGRSRAGRSRAGWSRAASAKSGAAPAGRPQAGIRARVSGGRPARLALRVGVATAAATLGVLAADGGPAGPALAVGAATWLVLTARQDLRPP
jgi:curved DNA-binding protein CbpA